VRLEYEAYEEMAVKEMEKLCATARAAHPEVTHVVVHHRLGIVPVGEASVIIAVSSPHRKEAIECCHFTIDTLKAKVPIWKKELYSEGDPEWKKNKEAFEGTNAAAAV
jgi:molybdopterin synthase catalytic subunit